MSTPNVPTAVGLVNLEYRYRLTATITIAAPSFDVTPEGIIRILEFAERPEIHENNAIGAD